MSEVYLIRYRNQVTPTDTGGESLVTETKWVRSHEFLATHPEFARNSFYRMARNGELLTVKIGRRLFVRSDAMDVLAKQQLEDKQTATHA